jgi:hypothetical protein
MLRSEAPRKNGPRESDSSPVKCFRLREPAAKRRSSNVARSSGEWPVTSAVYQRMPRVFRRVQSELLDRSYVFAVYFKNIIEQYGSVSKYFPCGNDEKRPNSILFSPVTVQRRRKSIKTDKKT